MTLFTTDEEIDEIVSVMSQCGHVKGLPVSEHVKFSIGAVLSKQYGNRIDDVKELSDDHQDAARRVAQYRDANISPKRSPVGYALLTEVAGILERVAKRKKKSAQKVHIIGDNQPGFTPPDFPSATSAPAPRDAQKELKEQLELNARQLNSINKKISVVHTPLTYAWNDDAAERWAKLKALNKTTNHIVDETIKPLSNTSNTQIPEAGPESRLCQIKSVLSLLWQDLLIKYTLSDQWPAVQVSEVLEDAADKLRAVLDSPLFGDVTAKPLMTENETILQQQVDHLRDILRNPPTHLYWSMSEANYPEDLTSKTGKLPSLRCKICGETDPRVNVCQTAVDDLIR